MRANGGASIVIAAPNSGCQCDRGMIPCAMTKQAVVAMVLQMAADYARDNIPFKPQSDYGHGLGSETGSRSATRPASAPRQARSEVPLRLRNLHGSIMPSSVHHEFRMESARRMDRLQNIDHVARANAQCIETGNDL